MKICSIKDCGKKHCARGLCPMHYRRKFTYKHIPLEANPRRIYGKGFLIDKDGYRQVRNLDGKYVREHRLIMSNFLKRDLLRSEVVHHKNRNILDNRIENLELMTFRNHALHHKFKYIDIKYKQEALKLYREGISMTKIPKIIPISYSCVYWFIRNSGEPIRGVHNRTLRKNQCPPR